MYPGSNCLMDKTEDGGGYGVRTFHVFLGEYKTYCGEQIWPKLRANPESLYKVGRKVLNPKEKLGSDLPRTIAEADSKDWKRIDDGCADKDKRYIFG